MISLYSCWRSFKPTLVLYILEKRKAISWAAARWEYRHGEGQRHEKSQKQHGDLGRPAGLTSQLYQLHDLWSATLCLWGQVPQLLGKLAKVKKDGTCRAVSTVAHRHYANHVSNYLQNFFSSTILLCHTAHLPFLVYTAIPESSISSLNTDRFVQQVRWLLVNV